jgi:hypothetical protein
MFVNVDQLAEVVIEPARLDFPDGSAVIVAPGVRAEHESEGKAQRLHSRPHWRSEIGDFRVSIYRPLPTGSFYSPIRSDDTLVSRGITGVDQASFAGGTAQAACAWVYARSTSKVTAVGNHCLIVLNEMGYSNPASADHYVFDTPPAWVIEAYTAKGITELTWPDGSFAGRVYHPHVHVRDVVDMDDRRCFTPTNGRGHELEGLTVCVDRDAMFEDRSRHIH